MSKTTQTSQKSDDAEPSSPGEPGNNMRAGPPPRRASRWVAMSVIAIMTFFAGAVTAGAFGGGGGGGGWMGHGSFGPAGHWGGWRHGRFLGENPDPAQIEKRLTRVIGHVAIEIDASKDQQEQLVGVAMGAIKDLLPMRKSFREARGKARAMLTATTIDRDAIEGWRTAQMAQAELASKRVAKALADAAEILTAQQRQDIGKRIERFRSFRKRWFRG